MLNNLINFKLYDSKLIMKKKQVESRGAKQWRLFEINYN